jgi:predicted small metal-binding protein
MERVLRCDCGFEAHADDEPHLVLLIQRHALRIHGMRFSTEEALQLASRAESAESDSVPRTGSEIREDAS